MLGEEVEIYIEGDVVVEPKSARNASLLTLYRSEKLISTLVKPYHLGFLVIWGLS